MIGEKEVSKEKGTRFYTDNGEGLAEALKDIVVDDTTHIVEVKHIIHKGKKYELQENGELILVSKNDPNRTHN